MAKRLGVGILICLGLLAVGCTTLSTNNGVAVPHGLFDGDSRTPIASYKMWLPQMSLGLVQSLGGTTKLSSQVPDIALFTTGRKEFIQKTSGKNIDIQIKWYAIFIEVIAFARGN